MGKQRPFNWFQWMFAGVFVFIMTILVYVGYIANQRVHRFPRMDAAEIQMLRHDAYEKKGSTVSASEQMN
jgi:threonine/homoserine/homoserine lactone efflux protein